MAFGQLSLIRPGDQSRGLEGRKGTNQTLLARWANLRPLPRPEGPIRDPAGRKNRSDASLKTHGPTRTSGWPEGPNQVREVKVIIQLFL